MNGFGHRGSVDPGVQTNLVVVAALVVFGHLGSFGFEEQFGGHLGSVDPGVQENLVVVVACNI